MCPLLFAVWCCYLLFVVCASLFVVCWLLRAVCCLLCVLMGAVRCSAVCCLLYVCCLFCCLFVVRFWSFVACCRIGFFVAWYRVRVRRLLLAA